MSLPLDCAGVDCGCCLLMFMLFALVTSCLLFGMFASCLCFVVWVSLFVVVGC